MLGLFGPGKPQGQTNGVGPEKVTSCNISSRRKGSVMEVVDEAGESNTLAQCISDRVVVKK